MECDNIENSTVILKTTDNHKKLSAPDSAWVKYEHRNPYIRSKIHYRL